MSSRFFSSKTKYFFEIFFVVDQNTFVRSMAGNSDFTIPLNVVTKIIAESLPDESTGILFFSVLNEFF